MNATRFVFRGLIAATLFIAGFRPSWGNPYPTLPAPIPAAKPPYLVITESGATDTETIRGTNPSVVVTQSGNNFTFTTTEPSSRVSLTRTFTLSGNNIVSGSGLIIGFQPGTVTTSQNQITSATGTVSQGRIEPFDSGPGRGCVHGPGIHDRCHQHRRPHWKRLAHTNTPPTISVQPVGRSVTAGASVSFTVSVAGSPPFTYQWRKNGADIAGATSASSRLPAFRLGMPEPTLWLSATPSGM